MVNCADPSSLVNLSMRSFSELDLSTPTGSPRQFTSLPDSSDEEIEFSVFAPPKKHAAKSVTVVLKTTCRKPDPRNERGFTGWEIR
ncbi:unnamed protein product [Allacma fusca]|uniref:Uncharacterized protein n=1 Tax=Allacma fusca TaxID=39272 RepID=A0A8J2P0Q7_9HEXA|nr:unnamed protein product [Allacma fusca]